VPTDSVSVAPAYEYEASRLPPGTSIRTADRLVRVAARAAQPSLAVLNDVFSAEECEELMALARPRLAPSTTVDPLTGRDRAGEQRGSLGMFFRLRESAFIARIDERLSDLMNLPVENGEGLQVLRYRRNGVSRSRMVGVAPTRQRGVLRVLQQPRAGGPRITACGRTRAARREMGSDQVDAAAALLGGGRGAQPLTRAGVRIRIGLTLF